MFVFGSGTKNKQKQISETQVVMNSFRFAHVMFVSWVTWGYQYRLMTLHEDGWHAKVITKQEAVSLTGGNELMPNLWMRYSLLAVLGSSLATTVAVLLVRLF